MECRRLADPLGVMDGLEPREGYPGGKGGIFLACVVALLLLPTAPVQAQHNHAQGHPDYQHWVNKVGRECCNSQDCVELREQDERTTATGGIEVRVEGKWCPIKPHHYLQTGNAPNWSTSHVCVLKAAPWQIMPVCDRLLCYQPKPGI